MMQTLREITLFHHRIANIRSNASHQMTATLSQEYQIIVLEDLNIKGMLQNGKLSKAISDAALYEKRRQFEYKAIDVITVGRWFPSSKTCSNCGFINAELTLSQRQWKCPECNSILERDENAAKNLLKEGLRLKQQNNSPGGSPVTGQSISLDHKIA
jgi:putative transposase